MDAGSNAGSSPLMGGSQKIALKLDGGEVIHSIREIGEGPVATGRICQGDDHGGVPINLAIHPGGNVAALFACFRLIYPK